MGIECITAYAQQRLMGAGNINRYQQPTSLNYTLYICLAIQANIELL